MIVTCPGCGARYRVNPARIRGRGARITCPKCTHRFVVYKEGSEQATAQAKRQQRLSVTISKKRRNARGRPDEDDEDESEEPTMIMEQGSQLAQQIRQAFQQASLDGNKARPSNKRDKAPASHHTIEMPDDTASEQPQAESGLAALRQRSRANAAARKPMLDVLGDDGGRALAIAIVLLLIILVWWAQIQENQKRLNTTRNQPTTNEVVRPPVDPEPSVDETSPLPTAGGATEGADGEGTDEDTDTP